MAPSFDRSTPKPGSGVQVECEIHILKKASNHPNIVEFQVCACLNIGRTPTAPVMLACLMQLTMQLTSFKVTVASTWHSLAVRAGVLLQMANWTVVCHAGVVLG